jgi:GT2 family glycosyltransferase
MDAAPTAPPVVAVVVSHNSGPWLEESLAALDAQDYPNLSVLVIDAASDVDPTPRVAAVLPSAYVRRIDSNPGFGPAANEVLEVVEGASHFLFCHDDAAPDPDAVRAMVEEAFRSNAGIVAPKLVQWDAPERLLQVGMAADKSGAPSLLNERGELDQEQHDAVRDVFVAPGGFTLVRADLFATLGGFDPAISLYGEDLDLSWRAQIAGARVIVAPAARVRHLEAMSAGLRSVGDAAVSSSADLRGLVRPLQLRHRLRCVLKNYSLFHLLRVLPQMLLLAVAEVLYGLVLSRRRNSADIVRAWRWNLARRRELREARRALHKVRGLPDSEVRRLQVRGSARVNAFVRGQLGVEERARLAAVAGHDLGVSLRALRLPLSVFGAAALVLLFGSRGLLSGRLPAVGELVPFPDHVLDVLRPFLSGWRTTGLGSESPAPFAFALLSLGGTVLLGGMGFLQKLLVLGMLPLGAVGAYRFARPLGSVRVRLVAMAVYLAIPLPYNALARGRWSALLLYGSVPWLLTRLAQATGLPPFAQSPAPFPGTVPTAGTVLGNSGPGRLVQVARLGLLVALLSAFVPSAPLLVLALALALVVGSLAVGGAGAAGRAVVAAAGAVAVAVVVLFPWSLDFLLPGSSWSAITSAGVQPGHGLSLARLLRFQTGPLGAGPIGWFFLIAAALPLLIGAGWRFAWATRLWAVALIFWGLAWAAGRGWLPFALPAPDVVLVPAALALAGAAALGMAAFEADLPGYTLGWRQVASIVAAGAAVLGAVPVLGASVNGRWHLPTTDHAQLVSWMAEHRQEGAFRVLWVADADLLPGDGWRLTEGTAFATSRNGPPTVVDRWPGADPGSSGLIADALGVARTGGTTSLGHLLAPMAVRYIVVPLSRAPGVGGRMTPPGPDLSAALAAQLDLRRVDTDSSQLVYENVAWLPARALLDVNADVAADGRGLSAAVRADLSGARPVLTAQSSPTSFHGSLPLTGDVYLSEAASPRWHLRVAGHGAERRTAFGWANAFASDSAGKARISYSTSPIRWLALLIEAGFWFVLLRFLVRTRPRRAAEDPA